MPLAVIVASVIAVLTITAMSGWIASFLASIGGASRGVHALVALVSVGFGAVTYYVAYRFVRSRTVPLDRLAYDLRDAALRPRDHIRELDELLSRVPEAQSAEIHGVVSSLRLLLERIDQRHERQLAWVGAVAHDLKTPIAACANVLQVIVDQEASHGVVDETRIRDVIAELRGLTAGFQRMIDTVRFEREDLRIEREPLDLGGIARRVACRYEHRCRLEVLRIGEGPCFGDPGLVERAIENLVANATRYARSLVRIEVFACMLRIADDGHGLPAPLEHLSQPFRSQEMIVDGVSVAGGAGGIGLFVARRVLELHGGRLVVEATSARGTTLLAYVGSGRDG